MENIATITTGVQGFQPNVTKRCEAGVIGTTYHTCPLGHSVSLSCENFPSPRIVSRICPSPHVVSRCHAVSGSSLGSYCRVIDYTSSHTTCSCGLVGVKDRNIPNRRQLQTAADGSTFTTSPFIAYENYGISSQILPTMEPSSTPSTKPSSIPTQSPTLNTTWPTTVPTSSPSSQPSLAPLPPPYDWTPVLLGVFIPLGVLILYCSYAYYSYEPNKLEVDTDMKKGHVEFDSARTGVRNKVIPADNLQAMSPISLSLSKYKNPKGNTVLSNVHTKDWSSALETISRAHANAQGLLHHDITTVTPVGKGGRAWKNKLNKWRSSKSSQIQPASSVSDVDSLGTSNGNNNGLHLSQADLAQAATPTILSIMKHLHKHSTDKLGYSLSDTDSDASAEFEDISTDSDDDHIMKYVEKLRNINMNDNGIDDNSNYNSDYLSELSDFDDHSSISRSITGKSSKNKPKRKLSNLEIVVNDLYAHERAKDDEAKITEFYNLTDSDDDTIALWTDVEADASNTNGDDENPLVKQIRNKKGNQKGLSPKDLLTASSGDEDTNLSPSFKASRARKASMIASHMVLSDRDILHSPSSASGIDFADFPNNGTVSKKNLPVRIAGQEKKNKNKEKSSFKVKIVKALSDSDDDNSIGRRRRGKEEKRMKNRMDDLDKYDDQVSTKVRKRKGKSAKRVRYKDVRTTTNSSSDRIENNDYDSLDSEGSIIKKSSDHTNMDVPGTEHASEVELFKPKLTPLAPIALHPPSRNESDLMRESDARRGEFARFEAARLDAELRAKKQTHERLIVRRNKMKVSPTMSSMAANVNVMSSINNSYYEMELQNEKGRGHGMDHGKNDGLYAPALTGIRARPTLLKHSSSLRLDESHEGFYGNEKAKNIHNFFENPLFRHGGNTGGAITTTSQVDDDSYDRPKTQADAAVRIKNNRKDKKDNNRNNGTRSRSESMDVDNISGGDSSNSDVQVYQHRTRKATRANGTPDQINQVQKLQQHLRSPSPLASGYGAASVATALAATPRPNHLPHLTSHANQQTESLRKYKKKLT